MLLILEAFELDSIGVCDGAGLRHHLGKVEVIEFVHQIFAIGEVQFECELGLEVRGKIDMFESLVGRCYCVVD